MMEWRKTFLPFYEVSEYGDLRLLTNRSNRLAGTILTGSVKAGGYREYKIRWKGKEHHLGAHRLVLLAFIGEPPTPDHGTGGYLPTDTGPCPTCESIR